MPRRTIWRPHDTSVPVSQGDLLLVAWAKTIAPSDVAHTGSDYPPIGTRDNFDVCLWDGQEDPRVLEMWGRANYSLAVVITEGCAIDKEFNVLREMFLAQGHAPEEATRRALQREEGFISVAEAWPVDAYPEHLRRGARSGAVGYVPFDVSALVPGDTRTYAVDLSRVATIRVSSIHKRLGMADARWVLGLQAAICRYFAARTIRVTEDLTEIFQQPVTRVEALTPPMSTPSKVRVTVHFEGGRKVDLESMLTEARSEEAEEEERRPGLRTRE